MDTAAKRGGMAVTSGKGPAIAEIMVGAELL